MISNRLKGQSFRQVRNENELKQRMGYLAILLGAMMILLLGIYVVDAFKLSETAKTAKAPVTGADVDRQEIRNIKAFADIVTKPAGTLTEEDLALVKAKAHNFCYEKNVMRPKEQMIKAIMRCKGVK